MSRLICWFLSTWFFFFNFAAHAATPDHYQGKVIRIAHIGYMGAFDVITAIAALEMALRKFGAEIPFGRGLAAAEEVLMEALS